MYSSRSRFTSLSMVLVMKKSMNAEDGEEGDVNFYGDLPIHFCREHDGRIRNFRSLIPNK